MQKSLHVNVSSLAPRFASWMRKTFDTTKSGSCLSRTSCVFLYKGFCLLLFLGGEAVHAEKPVVDWYCQRGKTPYEVPAFFERPNFIISNQGKHSDVVILNDWTLLEVDKKRAEGYKIIVGYISEPSAAMNRLFDPTHHPIVNGVQLPSWIEANLRKFDLILTCNAYLLKTYPDLCHYLHPLCYASLFHQGIHPKSKLCSHMVSCEKQKEGHRLRWAIAQLYGNYFDACKEGDSPFVEKKDPWLNDFCFSVIVENSREAHYFSEKILECMRAGTVPIYWGCPTIGDFFDMEGIITFDSLKDLEPILKNLSFEDYEKRLPAIRRNFELAGKYPLFRLLPLRHHMPILIDPECTWHYDINEPDVFDAMWPYLQPYLESKDALQK